MTLFEQLELHEGRRRFPYTDTVGKLTIGIGRNLTDRGLSDDEIDYLLSNDIRECMDDLKTFPWWDSLNSVRQNVLIDMRLNLGASGFRKFKATIEAVAQGDYVKASEQMQKSKWAAQVKTRAQRLVRMMATGVAIMLFCVTASAQTIEQHLDAATASIAAAKALMVPPVPPVVTVNVPAGGNVQAALDSAVAGAVVQLAPGTYQGPIILKDGKTLKSETSTYATVTCPDQSSAIRIEGVASVVNLHIQCNGNDLIYLTANANALIQGNRIWGNGSAKNGITLNGQGVIRANDIDYIYRVGQESHGILHTSGGPFLIENNDIKAASINYLSGGDTVASDADQPHDVTFTGNRLEKRIEWRVQSYVAKNLFELKMMRNLTASGNTYTRSWAQGQDGVCLSLGIRNQYGPNPYAIIENVVMQDEVFTNCGSGISILGRDYSQPSQVMRNVQLKRITINDLSSNTWGGSGRVAYIQGGPIDLVIEDLIVVKGAGGLNSLLTFSRPAEVGTGFIARRWDVPEGQYGIQHDGSGTTTRGTATLNWFFPGLVWDAITIRRPANYCGCVPSYPSGTTVVP